jgi:hypothetical protein
MELLDVCSDMRTNQLGNDPTPINIFYVAHPPIPTPETTLQEPIHPHVHAA